MYKEGSFDLEDSAYHCPKCSRSFSALQNLRDHLDIVHIHQPTRDTDEENFSAADTSHATISRLSVKRALNSGRGSLNAEALEIERQLQRAKELELRHKIFHRHAKSQDELKALNDDILNAKQRQYEMCNIIHNAREQIESLRESAEKVASDQHTMIYRLKEELKVKDSQLEKSQDELRRLGDMRLKQQASIEEVVEEREQQREAIIKLSQHIQAREKHINEKQKEVTTLKEFISSATQKELQAREKLQGFIGSLLERAEGAESQVQNLQKIISEQNQAVAGPRGQMSPYPAYREEDRVMSPNHSQYNRPTSANDRPYVAQQPRPYTPRATDHHGRASPRREPSWDGFSPPPPSHEVIVPVTHDSIQASPASNGDAFHSRKLPSGPFRKSPEASVNPAYVAEGRPSAEQIYRRRGPGKHRHDGRDGDRPESGYSSVQHGYSRPHSQLSNISENSVVSSMGATYDQEYLRDQGIVFSDDLDLADDVSEIEIPPELKIDENGIVWEDRNRDLPINSSYPPSKTSSYPPSRNSSYPPSKNSSLTRNINPKLAKKSSTYSQKPGSSTYGNRPPSPLNMSRLSSLNSTDKEILNGVNSDAKFEIQRHKFLLRDRLRMLKEQEKLFRKERLHPEHDGIETSDSDLTSVTDDDTPTSSLSWSSDSEPDRDVMVRGKDHRAPITRAAAKSQTSPSKKLVFDRSLENGTKETNPPKIRPMTKVPPVDIQTQLRQRVLFLTFMYLDTVTLSRMAMVCKEWKQVSRHPALWRKVILAKARITSKG